MTDTDLEIIVFVLLAVAIGVYVCVSSSIKRKKAAENAIKKAWGKRAVYKGTDERKPKSPLCPAPSNRRANS